MLTRMIGDHNVAGSTLASLATQFGLQVLIGKPLSIIPDARIGEKSDTIVERLLSISGEDTISIPRKFLSDWTGRLPTRLVMLSNQLPKFKDSSRALANRFIILRLTGSWLGK